MADCGCGMRPRDAVDKGTVASRYQFRYGKDWDEIQEVLDEEQATANQANADIGAMILRNFNRGEGTQQPQERQREQVPPNGRQPVNGG